MHDFKRDGHCCHEATNDPSIAEHGANRLIREKSPYLLQHANNPVDWYRGDRRLRKSGP